MLQSIKIKSCFALAFLCGLSTVAIAESPRLVREAEAYATWIFAGGDVAVTLEPDALAQVGVQLADSAQTVTMTMPIQSEGTSFSLNYVNEEASSAGGAIVVGGSSLHIIVPGRDEPAEIGSFTVTVSGRRVSIVDGMDMQRELFASSDAGAVVDFNTRDQRITIAADLVISQSFAVETLGDAAFAGTPVGHLEVTGPIQLGDYQAFPAPTPSPRAGADVTVGALTGDVSGNPRSWGSSGGIYAYSVGTTSCNIGTVPLEWIDNVPNRYPVIGQNLFRLKTEPGTNYQRFEQVGQSWLKHGFCALQQNLCSTCTPYCGGCCNHLGVGCSDPYTAGRNGGWSDLGPKSVVNAAAGTFPTQTFASGPTNIRGRLQAQEADVDPDLNAGALYYVEGQYVCFDDATAGNKNNNASYRRVNINNNSTFSMVFVAGNGTIREQPGINAWRANDPAVTLEIIDIPDDGRMILGYKVTDNGDGTWHYEYALQNLNSHRSGQFFSVTSPECIGATNLGFHDVFYHSGDNIDGTDWTPTVLSDQIIWATQTFGANPNANALRWGSLYNFRFDAATPPTTGNIKIGLFRTGTPSLVTVTAQVPSALTCLRGDVNLDTLVDGGDVARFVEVLMSGVGTSVEKCAGDVESVKDCEIGLSDVDNFVDCLLNGGC